jgi:cysteine desulfurase/selenocysteine lyase
MGSAPSESIRERPRGSLRDDFAVTSELAYFATGNVNAPPHQVTDSLAAAVSRWRDKGDDIFADGLKARAAAKDHFSTLVGASSDQVALVKNTTEGITLVAHLVAPKAGENVVVDELCIQTNVFPWRPFERSGVEVRVVPARDDRVLVEDYERFIDDRTRAVSLCHVTMKTGFRVDVPSISELGHAVGAIVVVDVAQAAGAIPVDVEALGADALVCPTYKWLFGPAGIGFIWLGTRLRSLDPPMPGWNGVVDPAAYDILRMWLREDAQRFEGGMFPLLLCSGAEAGIQYLLDIGPSEVFQTIRNDVSVVHDLLVGMGFDVRTDSDPEHRAGLVFFSCPDAMDLVARLEDARVRVVPLLDGIRIDCAVFNNEEDIDRLARELRTFLSGAIAR